MSTNAFFDRLMLAATAPAESDHALPGRLGPWDASLDTFIGFLNEKYSDALRAFRKGVGDSAIVHVILHPRGRRNHRSTLFVLHVFTRSRARLVGDTGYELELPSELEERLTELVRTEAFRSRVEDMRALANEPVFGVLHGGGLRDRRPSTDVLVTIAPEEQARLAANSEPLSRGTLAIHVRLAGAAPAGRGVYDPSAELRWLVAGGYALELAPDGHVPESAGVVRLTGVPVDPAVLD